AGSLLHRPADLCWMGPLRHCPVRRFGNDSGAHDHAAQAEPPIRQCARRLFVRCCQRRHLFHWTFPTNQATSNWTVVPKNWNELRIQWEYSHAVNAVVMFVALACVVVSVLRQPSSAGGIM